MFKYTKTAYELACERIIAPKYKKEASQESKTRFDFVEIPEFSNREDKVVETNETKLIEDPKQEINKQKEEKMENIRIQEPETIHTDNLLEVHWNGSFLDYGGFARMNRTMAFGLSNKNVKVKVDIEPYLVHVNQSTQEQLRAMANLNISPNAPKVYGVTVPINISHPGRKIAYTMIETSEKVHKDYAEKLNLMDEIWVATEYGKKILNKSNVHPPIYVMPLGVDTFRYKQSNEIMNFGNSTRNFKFLSVFRWSYRKGFDILIRAFLEEFSSDEDVSLIMASRNLDRLEETGPQKILEDFSDIKNTINKPEEKMPHIALYTKPIHEKDMPKVYNSADAFVLISRGEGFGLTVLEASACGIPVISSNCSGHMDFLSNDNSFLVEPDGYIEAKVAGNMSRMAKLCHFYEGQIFPDFSNTGVKQTREKMRFVFENHKLAVEKNKKLQKLINDKYTWDIAINRVYNRIADISL